MRAPNLGTAVLTAGLATFSEKIFKRTFSSSMVGRIDGLELLRIILDEAESEWILPWLSTTLMLAESAWWITFSERASNELGWPSDLSDRNKLKNLSRFLRC